MAASLGFYPLDRHPRPALVGRIPLLKRLLERRQRDHLTPCLEKPLQPPLEPEVAVGIGRDEVAGAIPPLSLEFDEGRGPVIAVVAAEHGWSTHQQHSGRALGHSRAGLLVHEPGLHVPHWQADAAGLDLGEPVGGHDR